MTPASTPTPAELRERMKAADDLLAAGKAAEAERAYHRILSAAPDFWRASLALARAARRRGDRQASLAFSTAAARHVAAVPLRLDIATDLRELGRLDEAEAAFAALLAEMPNNIPVLLGLGRCARRRGDHRAALARFQAAMALDPGHVFARRETAQELRELGRLAEAEAAYAALLLEDPGNIPLAIGQAQCARRRGDYRTSLARLEAAAETAPGHVALRLETALDLRELYRLEEAEAVYTELLAVAAGDVRVHLGLGQCARRRGDRAAALAHFRKAADVKPELATPLIEIASEQRDAGEVAAALQTVRAVLAAHPDDLAAWMTLGSILRAAGRHEEALGAYQAAHRARPARAGPLVEMAIEERTLGRQAACDALLAKARTLEPHNLTLLSRLGAQLMIAEPEDALAFYDEALREQPGQLPLELSRLQALVPLGRTAEALAHVDLLAHSFGALPNVLASRLSLLRQAGHHHAALAQARTAAAARPRNFPLWAERMRLELLVGARDGLDACLAQSPAATSDERAAALRFSGGIAEDRWQLGAAAAFYEQAAALQPENAAPQIDMTRISLLMLDEAKARTHLRRHGEVTAPSIRLKRKSLNISQTHFGQVLDDYTLDRGLLGLLREATALPLPARIARLIELVAKNPDSTAAAVSLMLALRQGGAWNRRDKARSGDGVVAKTINQFWDAEDPPEDVAGLMQSWQKLNPDHRYRRASQPTARRYLAQHFKPAVLSAFDRVPEPAQKADIFRLALLALEGGIYADADDRCLRPAGTILPEAAALVMYQEDQATIGNNFIAAAPRHPVLVHALNLAVTAVNRGDADNVWLATGPALLTRAFAQVLAAGAVRAEQLGASIILLNGHELRQAVAFHCAAGYKRTRQHWSHSSFPRSRQARGAGVAGGAENVPRGTF